jgi:hypothetical protein
MSAANPSVSNKIVIFTGSSRRSRTGAPRYHPPTVRDRNAGGPCYRNDGTPGPDRVWAYRAGCTRCRLSRCVTVSAACPRWGHPKPARYRHGAAGSRGSRRRIGHSEHCATTWRPATVGGVNRLCAARWKLANVVREPGGLSRERVRPGKADTAPKAPRAPPRARSRAVVPGAGQPGGESVGCEAGIEPSITASATLRIVSRRSIEVF